MMKRSRIREGMHRLGLVFAGCFGALALICVVAAGSGLFWAVPTIEELSEYPAKELWRCGNLNDAKNGRYRFTASDGHSYEISAPEGVTFDQVLEEASREFTSRGLSAKLSISHECQVKLRSDSVDARNTHIISSLAYAGGAVFMSGIFYLLAFVTGWVLDGFIS